MKLEGLVLRKKILRDSDLALSVFSKTAGRLWLVKERALKKPQAGLDLFCRNEFVLSRLQDFGLIYQAASLELFAGLRRDYTRMQTAAEAVKLIEKITSSLQANAGLYNLLLQYLRTLADLSIAAAKLDNIKLQWYQTVLENEGIYDGRPVTEKNFRRQIADYRG
ncbi:MAG: recombination protein O N-terminal domain-containing protein [Candidatus Margulisbacteria bacterium]|jgi:DNA repair protein RecO|nr:recombination protein O N-terminal domain-containing protein [Candidatus Margulisiibacteriota bacterium]